MKVSGRFTQISIFLLFAVWNVRDSHGAKCTFSFVSGSAVCNNVNSFREVALEIRSTWINVKINNQLGGSFDMVLRGMYDTTEEEEDMYSDDAVLRLRRANEDVSFSKFYSQNYF